MKIPFFFFLLTLITLGIKGADKKYFFEQISPDYGFVHDGIRTITEDSNGFLWYGSSSGVYYYNNSETRHIILQHLDSSIAKSPVIYKLKIDDQEQIWACTNDGLYRYERDEDIFKEMNLYTPDLSSLNKERLQNIVQIDNNNYILHTLGNIYLFNKSDSLLKTIDYENEINNQYITFITKYETGLYIGTGSGRLYQKKKNKNTLNLIYESKKISITALCEDGNKFYVGFRKQGVEVINRYGKIIEEFSTKETGRNKLSGNLIRDIIKTNNGEIWIGAYSGLTILSKDGKNHYDYQSNVGLPNSSIYTLHKGKGGGIWIGTWAGGIAYYKDYNYHFTHVTPISEGGIKFENIITSFTEGKDETIWIGSERKGISLLKTNLKDIDKYKTPTFDFNYQINNVRTLRHLNNNHLAIGTFNEGLLIYNTNTSQIEKKFPEIQNNMTTAHDNNELWVGGFGLHKINLETDEVIDLASSLREINNKVSEIRFLFFDSAHSLWFCTNVGLFVKHKESKIIIECNTKTANNSESTSIYTCLEDSKGKIWLGTKGKGIHIYHPNIDSTKRFRINNMVDNSNIYSLIEDKNNDLWFSSNHGIFRYMNEYKTINHFTEIDGISGKQFIPNSSFLCSNGYLLFGASNGFTVINPNIIKENIAPPDVFLSKLEINNKSYSKKNTVKCNSYIIESLKEITLKNQPTLNIKVVTNNYIKSEKNRIKYRLVNYENNWIEIPENKEIAYTKLPPGNYIFEAYGSNNDQHWSSEPYRLKIKVKYPLFLRWYFIILYLIILEYIAYIVIKNSSAKIKLKNEILNERYKSQASHQINEERVHLFMNISHEIRTPLSLIMSPVQLLLSRLKFDSKSKEMLEVIDRNAKRLLRLTDQSLDFGLIKENKLKSNIDRTDIIQIAANTYQYFEHQILDKKLDFSFKSKFKNLEIISDTNLIEKIVFNLLSNAVKYTKEEDRININVYRINLEDNNYDNIIYSGNKFTGKAIAIEISDTGKGIDNNTLKNIFELSFPVNDKHQAGIGLGLFLCTEYAKLIEGNIMVNSKNNTGSTFTLNLPFRYENNYEIIKDKDKEIITHIKSQTNENIKLMLENSLLEDKTKKTILIVENNNEYRSFLKTYLGNYYKIITSKNVEQAIDILTTLHPDIILTELIFQDMDGLQLIDKLKTDGYLNNIPIIVLTSNTKTEYHIDCIVKGVDSYFTKPIDNNLLLAKIQNLTIPKNEGNAPQKTPDIKSTIKGMSLEPESFVAIAELIIEENFQNINFDSNILSEKLNTSQSTLYRKIKNQTNLSTTEFIREVRLKKALDLLKSNKFTNDEIATYIGFNSTSYFIRSFKKRYGKTPREFAQSENQIE